MKIISQIPYKEIEISFMEEPGFIGYSFGYLGKNYGSKIELKTKKRLELIEATAALMIQAIQSYEAMATKEDKDGK